MRMEGAIRFLMRLQVQAECAKWARRPCLKGICLLGLEKSVPYCGQEQTTRNVVPGRRLTLTKSILALFFRYREVSSILIVHVIYKLLFFVIKGY